jgi:stage IV sporulation protein B
MKKIMILMMLLIIPINVWAYSKYVIPGGNTLGITVKNDGIMVIGFYRVQNKINRNNLKVGDIITKVNDTSVTSIDELVKAIESSVSDNKVNLEILRDNSKINISFELIYTDGTYKTGLYVKDSITGIGTLSYIDPSTKIYGALGHEIADSNSGKLIEVKTGSIYKSYITSIDRSTTGVAGSKNARFYDQEIYGNVVKNTNKGIYGIYSADISSMKTLEVGTYNDIKLDKAYIATVLNGETIKDYEILIDNVNNNETKNIHFVITDEDLINEAGGIVQGMSGSPIIQNNKIIGAVTHVIVDNPTTGYGILITNMLKEGEK